MIALCGCVDPRLFLPITPFTTDFKRYMKSSIPLGRISRAVLVRAFGSTYTHDGGPDRSLESKNVGEVRELLLELVLELLQEEAWVAVCVLLDMGYDIL